MADCEYHIGNKTYNEQEFKEYLAEGGLDTFVKDGSLPLSAIFSTNKNKQKAEVKTQIEPKENNKSESAEYTHINKNDITTQKEIAEKYELNGGKVAWNETVDKAINDLAIEADNEKSDIFSVAENKINGWHERINKDLEKTGKTTFNPSDEELAVMSYYRTKLFDNIKSVNERLKSDNPIVRDGAIAEARAIENKILTVDRVISESGRVAGRSFYIRQMIAKMNADNSVDIKRMDIISKQNGEPLTAEQELGIAKITAKEKELQKEAEENIPKFSQEDFDKKVRGIVAEELGKIKNKKQDTGSSKKQQAKVKLDEAREAFRKASSGMSSGGLQALSEFVNLVKAYADYGFQSVREAFEEFKKDFPKTNVNQNDFEKHYKEAIRISNEIDKSEILYKIKNESEDAKENGLTIKSVSKGRVNELVKNIVKSGIRGKEVFNTLHDDLKTLFPNMTEQQVRDAYLKQGEFFQEKKAEIDKDLIDATTELRNIAKYEDRLAKAKENKTQAKTESKKRQATEQEQRIHDELKSELNKRNIKFERGSKDEVDAKKKLAEVHNERMDDLIKSIDEKLKDKDLSVGDIEALNNLKDTAELGKIDLKTSEKIDNALQKSIDKLRESLVEVVGDKDIASKVSNIISDFNKDLENTTQDIALIRYRRNLENRIKEVNRKIEAQEFDDTPPTVRSKTDAEAIRLQIEEGKLQAQYRRMQYLAEEKKKTWYQKAIHLFQTVFVQGLIGGIKTGVVVASSAVAKQPLNTLTNATFGKLAHTLFPTLSKSAGGEASITLRQEANRYKAHYLAMGENGMKRMWYKSQKNLDKANENYDNIKKQLDSETKGTPQYVRLEKQLEKAKNKQLQALITHQANYIFEWIGGNAWKDAGDTFLKGAGQLDVLLGHDMQVPFKDKTNLEKAEFFISVMGATHGYLKNFSARAEFAASFTARLENKANKGIDISQTDVILETAAESYVNFTMGKYQEDNFVTSAMNTISRTLEEVGQKPNKYALDKRPKNVVLGKVAAAAFKAKFPIVRTPVNIAREAIVEYLLGGIVAPSLQLKEVVKGTYNSFVDKSVDKLPIRQAIREQIMKLPPDKVDLIFRCYRKGGLGLVVIALGAMGFVKYGGFHDDDDWYRKHGQLKQHELEVFGVNLHDSILGKLMAKVLIHNGAMMPALMIANFRQAFDRYFDKEMKKEGTKNRDEAVNKATNEALLSSVKGGIELIPAFQSGYQSPLMNPQLPYGRAAAEITEYLDTDANGKQIKRDNSEFGNRFLINHGFRNLTPTKEKYDSELLDVVGETTSKKLELSGIKTKKDLANKSVDEIDELKDEDGKSIFGYIESVRLYNLLNKQKEGENKIQELKLEKKDKDLIHDLGYVDLDEKNTPRLISQIEDLIDRVNYIYKDGKRWDKRDELTEDEQDKIERYENLISEVQKGINKAK